MAKRSTKSGGSGKLLLGVILGASIAGGGAWLYTHPTALHGVSSSLPDGNYPGSPHTYPGQPSAAKPSPSALQKIMPAPSEVAPTPPRQPPFRASEEVFEAAAPLYRVNCASCHGAPGSKPRKTGAPQLWAAHAPDFSQRDPANLYQSIAHGTPNVPDHKFSPKLSSTQIWQLSLLVQQAGNELPDPVRNLMGP